MKKGAVSETIGAIILISVAVLAMGIVILVLSAGPLPTRVPSFSGLITNDSRTIYISHEGGDPLWRGQYKILVDGVDRTSSFVGPDPLTLGKNLSYTLPAMNARRVVMIFNTSWGGGTVLLSADLARKINIAPYGWYNGDWLYRKKITIDHTKVAADQTDFPILISKQDADLAQGMGKARTDANDILFTSSNGMTKLPHEIESFTTNNGAIVTWVKVPSLSSTTDTVIYMYYGNLGASSQQNAADVWSNGYAGVWHMGEATGTTRFDSTNDNNDVSETNGPITMSSSGQIANAADFVRASAQYLSITDAAQTGLDITGSITLEAWAKNDLTAAPPFTIIDKARGSCGSGDPPYYLRLNNGNAGYVREDTVVDGECGTFPTDSQGSVTSLTFGSWVHVVGTYNGSYTQIFKNAVRTDYQSYGLGILNSDGAFYIGSQVNANYFDGLIDEVRVSNTARSADWITTEYNNQYSPATFLSVLTEQTQTTMN